MSELREPWEVLDALCLERGWDYGIKADVAFECGWGAEVRVTREPNRRGRPDRSIVTYSAGDEDPQTCIELATLDMLAWLKEEESK